MSPIPKKLDVLVQTEQPYHCPELGAELRKDGDWVQLQEEASLLTLSSPGAFLGISLTADQALGRPT